MGTIEAEISQSAQQFLERVRSLLATNEFQVTVRGKNIEFLETYKIRDAKIKEMLLELTGKDCIDISPNNNPDYPDALVHTFLRSYELEYFGDIHGVSVYLKLYILKHKTYDLVMVISIHEEGNG